MIYDPEYLEIVGRFLDITRGTLFVDPALDQAKLLHWQTPLVDNVRGLVSGVEGDRGSANAVDSAYGTLVVIHFKAKQSGTTTIRLSNVSIHDSRLIPVDVRVVDKEIEIK